MNKRWNKENLENIIKNSATKIEVINKLELTHQGANYRTILKYANLFEIDIAHLNINKDKKMDNFNKKCLLEILVENSTFGTTHLKERLYNEGIKERKCELCGQDENWQGKKMSLILDHINGVHDDHRLDNLRIVCPNCNATLDTHCKGNRIIAPIALIGRVPDL